MIREEIEGRQRAARLRYPLVLVICLFRLALVQRHSSADNYLTHDFSCAFSSYRLMLQPDDSPTFPPHLSCRFDSGGPDG